MTFDPYITILGSLFKAWQGGGRKIRYVIGAATCLLLLAPLALTIANLGLIDFRYAQVLAIFFGVPGAALVLSVFAYQSAIEQKAKLEKIASVEEQVREHPDKPQLAWDLARAKLENYLDRNLSQVRSIYWLTLLVMTCGFSLVVFGLWEAFAAPEKLSVSIVSSASGVLISFIGGSFLIIYRSVLAQSASYVNVLERINAVGMAVQVIANIPDDSADLKHQTTAELARQLLGLYAPSSFERDKRRVGNIKRKKIN